MDCEAMEILEGAQNHLLASSKDPEIKMPRSFNKSTTTFKYGSRIHRDVQSVRQVLDTIKVNGVTYSEICIGNILPEFVDEVYGQQGGINKRRVEV
ncbi:DNA-directed RNA polymerases IV and V subunit 4-like [Dioscorea cayenensis subsp. rotundata]|uniref:DNA-directed RNA polymerases IV and V subunit 4-like n=1 Tax=Dioscorea cayennensis subsp. rotundata TaxID=55577 RepID=A0AB40D6R4_DIOCR|nr:DNA-directed RNA polymerases IV and V subunit 4-like [Dioscorea cayenensis subsp. rotundata]